MAKCYNCGNNFDYDKYYGICPKCSAYNREKLPEEEHQELHEQYDEEKNCGNLHEQEHQEMPESAAREYQNPSEQPYSQENWNPSGQPNSQGYQNPSGQPYSQGNQGAASGFNFQGQNTYGYVQLDQRPKSSSGSIVLFIFLILGIVAAIGTPFVYLIGKSMSLGVQVVKDATDIAGEWNQGGFGFPEDDWASLDDYEDEIPLPDIDQPRQSVEAVTKGIGEALEFGSGPMIVTVTDQAYVKIPAGQVGGFPKGENLVAVPVSYLDESTEYHTYNGLGVVYIRYGDQSYRAVLSPYDLLEYETELEQADVVDAYEMAGQEGQGVFLVFVPEGITEISLCMEERDEDTNQMQGLYEIPLEIRAEAPGAAQDGEVE